MEEEKVMDKTPQVKEWPTKGSTVKLARNPSVPKGKDGQSPFHTPPTVDGKIKIGMDVMIFMPSLEAQKAGFTPYKEVDGKAVDATQELLAHYMGIYKRVINP